MTHAATDTTHSPSSGPATSGPGAADHSASGPSASGRAVARLRLVLRANAAFSLVGGVVALVAGSWLSRELGIDHVVLTRLLGVGLIAFAINVALIARAREPRLLTEALLVSIGDAAWVVATIAVVASGVLTSAGNVVAILVGLAVADFGIAQFVLRRQAKRAEATPGPGRRLTARAAAQTVSISKTGISRGAALDM